jgi:hypothetical protein
MSQLTHQHTPDQRDHGFTNTGTPVGQNKYGADVKTHSTCYLVASDTVDAWTSSSNTITAASHSAKAGDIIRFTSGNMSGFELHVFSTGTNSIELAEEPIDVVAPGDAFSIYRYVTQAISSTGVATSSLTFDKDGVPTLVSEDTGTPANSVPLPVKLYSAAGPINITAGDINVQLSHAGANYDSTRLGDGTTLLGITASNEAKTFDATAHTKLDSLLTELQLKADLTETQPVSAASLPLPTGASTLGEQQTQTTALGSLLTELQLKADLTETQPVSVASLPLPTGASTLAEQQTQTGHLASIAAEDFATETTLAALNAKVTAVNTGAVTISTALPAGNNNIGDVDVASCALPTGASTLAEQQTQTTHLSDIKTSVQLIDNVISGGNTILGRAKVQLIRNDYSSVNVTTAAYVQLVASTASEINQLQIFDSSGQTLVLAVGAAASEVDQIYITPGGNGITDLRIPASSRISVKAVSATASVGELTINCLS